MRRRSEGALLAMCAMLAVGCTGDRATDGLVAVLLGSVLLILVVGFCGFSLFSGMLVGGAINMRQNLKQPTPKSRRWGFVFGGVNLLDGLFGVWAIVTIARTPSDDPPEADVYLLLAGGTLAALVIGVGCIVAAVRKPREPIETIDDAPLE